MTASEKQDVAQQLYDKNKRTLDKISKPRYSFSINSTNILFIDKFLPFVNQLELGSEITIRDNNDNLFNPILLEVTIDLENPKNIDWKFSESIRLSNDVIDVNEILGNVSSTQMTINSKMTQFIEYARNDKVNIYNYMHNGLRADVQEITNTINQEVTMNERGILCRLWLANESDYDNKQLKITNNRIMMTKDNWVTAENCFGEFTLPDGSKTYGLIANTIVGNLIIGNNLFVENSSGTFSVNKDGMTVTAMTMTLTNASATNRILLNGTDVIKVQKKVSGTWVDNLKLDTNGDLVISNYSTTTQMNSAISISASSLTATFNQTLTNNYSTTTQMNSAISASATSLTSTFTEQINTTNNNVSTISQTASQIALSINNTKVTINDTDGITVKNGGFKIMNGDVVNFRVNNGIMYLRAHICSGNVAIVDNRIWFNATMSNDGYTITINSGGQIYQGLNKFYITCSLNTIPIIIGSEDSYYYKCSFDYSSSTYKHDFYGAMRIQTSLYLMGKNCSWVLGNDGKYVLQGS